MMDKSLKIDHAQAAAILKSLPDADLIEAGKGLRPTIKQTGRRSMMEQHARLRQYNRWRRGDEDVPQPDPTELGELIEGVADRLECLEREHKQFYERWHAERLKREALSDAIERCHRMLLSDPDTKGALFKAENILREALAEAKDRCRRTDAAL